MASKKLKYLKFTPDMVMEFLRWGGLELPPDARIIDKMAFDIETGHIVCLVESRDYPEVTAPGEMTEIAFPDPQELVEVPA